MDARIRIGSAYFRNADEWRLKKGIVLRTAQCVDVLRAGDPDIELCWSASHIQRNRVYTTHPHERPGEARMFAAVGKMNEDAKLIVARA